MSFQSGIFVYTKSKLSPEDKKMVLSIFDRVLSDEDYYDVSDASASLRIHAETTQCPVFGVFTSINAGLTVSSRNIIFYDEAGNQQSLKTTCSVFFWDYGVIHPDAIGRFDNAKYRDLSDVFSEFAQIFPDAKIVFVNDIEDVNSLEN